MKKVLLFGTTDFDLSKENLTLKKKFENMARDMNVFVMARGDEKKWGKEMYDSKFYLIPKIGMFGVVFWLVKAYFKASKLIKEEKIDTIISQSPSFDGFVCALLAKKLKKKLIVEIHGDYIESLFFYYNFPKPVIVVLRTMFKFFGKYSLRRADKIRVISEATNKLAKMYALDQKIYKFPTFTDIDIFKAETDIKFEPTILYAGWLYNLKGVQFLIPAFQTVQEKYPEFKLIIIGDGPYMATLKKMAEEKKSNIEFPGFLPLTEVKNLMRNCTCFVLPSLSEGLGRVLIEAAMLRKPLIGTNVDGIPDIIKDGVNGFLFESGDVKELTEKLDKIMGDKELVMKMGEAGRKMVEDKFSTKKYFKAYRDMINE